MARKVIAVFESTLQKTYEWLHDILESLEWDDPQKAYQALRATLHALRDRLPMEVAVKLGAELPMLIRGFYYEGWKPLQTPIKIRHLDDFLELTRFYLNGSMEMQRQDIETIVTVVLSTMENHIDPGEIDHIMKVLPEPLLALF